MFEYFFILGSIFLILSGEMDKFSVNKAVSCSVLVVLLLLSMFFDLNIKHTVFLNWAGMFVAFIAVSMFFIMKNEHFSTIMYALTLGLLVWAVITIAPALNVWYLKAAAFSIFGALLSETYFQSSVISVFACIICDVFNLLLTVDLELTTLPLFVGDAKTTIIVSLILPIILIALYEKDKPVMLLEGINEISG